MNINEYNVTRLQQEINKRVFGQKKEAMNQAKVQVLLDVTQRYIKQADRKLFILTGLTNFMRNEQNPVWLVPINLISHGTSVIKNNC